MKRLIAFLLAAAVLLVLAAPVSAHALLVRSNPTPNAVLDSPPAQIELWLTEPVESGFTEIKVLSSSGARMDVGETQIDPADPMRVTVGLRSLPDGVYTVSWQALSVVDGHITLGTFPFAVGEVDAAALAAAGTASTSVVAANPGEIIPRWLSLLGAALVIGGYLFRACVWDPSWRETFSSYPFPAHSAVPSAPLRACPEPAEGTGPGGDLSPHQRQASHRTATEAEEIPTGSSSKKAAGERVAVIHQRFHALHSGGLILFLIANAAGLLWQIRVATGLPAWQALFDPALANLLFGARYGLLWLSRVAFMLVLLLSNARWESWLRYVRPLAAGGLLLTISLNSHAAAAPEPFWPVFSIWLHLVMATLWIGGLVHLAVGLYNVRSLRAHSRTRLAAELVPRFSNVGLATVGALLLTGVYNATVTVAAWSALFDSDYGRALLIKLALLAPLLALATVNLLILRPRLRAAAADGSTQRTEALTRCLRRTVTGEVLFGAALLLTASLFASTPPAESLGGRLSFSDRAEDLRLTLTITPGTIGFNTFDLHVQGADRRPVTDATEVALRFTPLSGELAPSEIELIHNGEGHYTAEGGNLSLPGGWQAQAVVRRTGEFDAFANFNFGLAAPGQAGTASNRPILFRYAALILYACGVLYLLALQGLARSRAQQTALGLLPALALALTGMGVLRAGNAQAQAALAQVNPIPPTQDSLDQGRAFYEQHCLPCHGPIGLGDGPTGLLLNPPPANLQDHMIPGAHTDVQIFKWISDGYPDSPMPAFRDVLTEEERWHLLNYIRTLVPEGYE